MRIQFIPTGKSFTEMQITVRDLGAKLQDGTEPMRQVSACLDAWVQRNFLTAGGKVGGWPPFKYGGRVAPKAKATGKSLGRWVDSSARLEMLTGTLRASFLPFSTDKSAGVGSELDYAAWQSNGTPMLPARRMLPFGPDVQDDIIGILQAWVNERIAK